MNRTEVDNIIKSKLHLNPKPHLTYSLKQISASIQKNLKSVEGIPTACWEGPREPRGDKSRSLKPLSCLQMLTFQIRPHSTNWHVLMDLTFLYKVPQVLTFSKRGFIAECFNSSEPPQVVLTKERA